MLDYIINNEGFRNKAYTDTKGVNTVGYGFAYNDPIAKKYIPQSVWDGKVSLDHQTAQKVLLERIALAESDAEKFVGAETYKNLSDNQRLALTDMSYNLGSTRLRKFKKMKEGFQEGDYKKASKELLDSKYAKNDVPMRALRNASLVYTGE